MWREFCAGDALLKMRNRATSPHHVTSILALVRRMTLMELHGRPPVVQEILRFTTRLSRKYIDDPCANAMLA